MRIRISGAQVSAQRQELLLECTIEQSADGAVWDVVPGSPERVALPLSALLGALRAPGSASEQRAAVIEVIRSRVRSLPLATGVHALERLEALLPDGWPVVVPL